MIVHVFGYDHYFSMPTHDAFECQEEKADAELALKMAEHQHGDMCWTLDKITFDEDCQQ